MKTGVRWGLVAVCVAGVARTEPAAPIRQVEVGPTGGFLVNGTPFFPLCSWLQGTNTYGRLRDLGFNVFMGNWQNKPPSDAMGAAALAAGGYALPHFDGIGIGHPGVFGWLDLDEPDITSRESAAAITPGKGLIVNKKAPLANMVDGNTRNSAAIDPMAGAAFTIALPQPVTATHVAVWITAGKPGAPAATTAPAGMTFLGDGRELLKVDVADKAGQQKFALPVAATFRALEVRVDAVRAGAQAWGQINEIEAFDAQGANVIKSEPRGKVRRAPEESLAVYRKIKAADPSRPVFLTLTCRFLPRYEQWHKLPVDEMRPLYPQWAAAADALGTDIYPLYGFSKPAWLLDNIEALKAMRQLAGPGKPLYVWIETCDGGAQQRADVKVLPRHTRAEVWMSIIAGARGIGYFTHAWRPKFSDFAPDAAMQAELKRLNAQIARLTPAILAKPAAIRTAITFAGGVTGHLLATEAPNGLHLFAQNLDVGGGDGLGGRAGQATITIEGLKAGTQVEVVDESRTVVAADGTFQDAFEALAEHIYRIPATAGR